MQAREIHFPTSTRRKASFSFPVDGLDRVGVEALSLETLDDDTAKCTKSRRSERQSANTREGKKPLEAGFGIWPLQTFPTGARTTHHGHGLEGS